MLTQITAPTSSPVTLAEVKENLFYSGDEHDSRLTALIAQAVAGLEIEADRSFCTTTWELVLPCFPCHKIRLMRPPLQGVTSIKYFNISNELTTLSTSDFYVMKPHRVSGWVQPVNSWPSTYCRPDAVTIRFTAGWDTVPNEVKRVILAYCGYLDSDRELTQQDFAALERMIGLVRNETY